MNRRHFLCFFPSLAAVGADAPRKITVGAHPWVYAAKQPNYDPTPVAEQIFREFGAAGIDAIELMHQMLLKDDSVSRIEELSKRYALPVLGTSWGANMWKREETDQIVAQGRTLIGRLAQVGGRTLGISVGDAGRKKTEDEFDTQAGVLRQIQKMCADHGVVPNLHNHIYEVRDNEYDLNGTLARLPAIKLGPDLNWLVRAKVDPVDFIWRHRDRMIFAHLRDQKADGRWVEAMGEGDTDFGAIGRMLHKIDFAGDLVIELAHERDFVPTRSYGASVRISREYVRRVMNY
ncbi:MAG: sugar phosphate isomerase/epimerase family protein [Bryobacteraceae bacterium]